MMTILMLMVLSLMVKDTCYALGKTAKIGDFWTFWPVIQLITGQNVQKLPILAVVA